MKRDAEIIGHCGGIPIYVSDQGTPSPDGSLINGLLFPGDERFYLVERSEDGVPTSLTPIEKPAHFRPVAPPTQ